MPAAALQPPALLPQQCTLAPPRPHTAREAPASSASRLPSTDQEPELHLLRPRLSERSSLLEHAQDPWRPPELLRCVPPLVLVSLRLHRSTIGPTAPPRVPVGGKSPRPDQFDGVPKMPDSNGNDMHHEEDDGLFTYSDPVLPDAWS
ncbi:hypothetical protein CFC21_018175 [Triticum aestivum]|uniref:Uncharacterized protein n=3 Tax=Triticum TaxID=4564 RepID=A0A9R1P0H7_TRITD|nr:hypothetical protein CFC21_018175 [Triticum aestivum]VAH34595.1 unnamed protein product [Triticum turgidum subsp. durum]